MAHREHGALILCTNIVNQLSWTVRADKNTFQSKDMYVKYVKYQLLLLALIYKQI